MHKNWQSSNKNLNFRVNLLPLKVSIPPLRLFATWKVSLSLPINTERQKIRRVPRAYVRQRDGILVSSARSAYLLTLQFSIRHPSRDWDMGRGNARARGEWKRDSPREAKIFFDARRHLSVVAGDRLSREDAYPNLHLQREARDCHGSIEFLFSSSGGILASVRDSSPSRVLLAKSVAGPIYTTTKKKRRKKGRERRPKGSRKVQSSTDRNKQSYMRKGDDREGTRVTCGRTRSGAHRVFG